MKRTIIAVSFLLAAGMSAVAPTFAQDKLGTFEYQGLRIGMTRSQVDAALAKYHKPEAIKWATSGSTAGRMCTVFENNYNMSMHLNLDKDTGRLIAISVRDKIHPFNVFRVQFLQRYGQPEKGSDTEYLWEVRTPDGCGPKIPCRRFERLDVSLDEGESNMMLVGKIE